MRLKIKTITLKNFKGVKDATYDFTTNNTVLGKNALGKTTIVCGYYWLMADCDSELHSNPAVFNIDGSESSPMVEIACEIDGKPVTLSRIVKKTVKKAKREGDADSVSFSSTYSVNFVEYGLRDFKARIEEYGITDKFLSLAHPDSFLSEKKDDMRKVLFGMVSNITDLDVAMTVSGVDETLKLLETYTFDEIAAMQNNSLRKVKEVYGKDGELLRSKIEGLESAKVDIDFAELELNRNLLKEKIEKNQDAQRIGNLLNDELDKLRQKQMKLQFELSGLEQKRKNEKDLANEKSLIERKSKEDELNSVTKALITAYADLRTHDGMIEFMQKEVGKYAEKVEQIKATVFDDNSTVCPVCHRVYESERVEELKKHFEDDKKSKLEEANSALDLAKKDLENKKPERTLIEIRIKQLENSKTALEKALSEPTNVSEITNDGTSAYQPEIDRLNAEIESVNNLMESKKSSMPNMASLSAEEMNLQGELRECEIQLGKADLNNEIDEKIEALRKQQIEFEQAKANAEKILYQLSLIKQAKNTRLTDEINKHFKLVKWKLYDYQKNGEIKDVVIPTVNGKDLGVALNNALVIRAKMDICMGLQNFYNEHYTIFVDNAESLDTHNQTLLGNDTQIIRLCVSDDKELTFKEV